jgi:FlaA1/EpsC-like NDP-sugar epimerase
LTILLSAFRLLIPLLANQSKSNYKEKAIIIGSGKVGLLTKQFIENSPGSTYKIMAFADDDPTHEKKFLDGTPILKPDKIKDPEIKKAIFPISDDRIPDLSNKIKFYLERGFKILKVPIKANWGGDILQFEEIKPFEIEDLLGREPIKTLDLEKENVFLGKTIMITGAAGSIGSQIAKHLIDYKPGKLILVDQAESPLVNIELECKEKYFFPYVKPFLGNICDMQKMEEIFSRERPEFIFHVAAYKHVPIIEDFPDEAVKTNIQGTKILADLAHKYETLKFIMISTDKAVNPTNVMGASKRIAEIYCQSLNKISSTAFITTRFGNVLGSTGSVVPRFKEQIEKGGPLTVTHPEVKRYFMTIQEASLLVIEAGVLGEGGEIFLFDMGDPIKIVDLAKKMVLLSGKDISIVFTGLRPGEKLYEELLATKENTRPTLHPRLKIAEVLEMEYENINKKIEHLIHSLTESNEMVLVSLMKSIVQEYKSENSPFEKLDFH